MSTPEMRAIAEMRARNITDPELLLPFATVERIIATCRWWDKLAGVGTGLLVKRIREGGVDPAHAVEQPPDAAVLKGRDRRRRFAEVAGRFPAGSVTETHRSMQDRQWSSDLDRCDGRMVVLDRSAFRCWRCAVTSAGSRPATRSASCRPCRTRRWRSTSLSRR